MSTYSEYFEVTISPPVARNVSEESVPTLMLAPFSSIPKLDFQDVKVGSNVEKEVIIRNPSQGNVIIDLNIPLEMLERGFSVNALTFELSACSQTRLKIEWNPTTAGQWRDTIRVVHVNGKCKFAHILVTSSSTTHTTRQPLRRIPPSAVNRVTNTHKVAKTHLKSNCDLKQSSDILNKPSVPSVEFGTPASKQCADVVNQSSTGRAKENQETFVLGTLPICDVSPVQIHRTTYVKHPGFPPFHHNLPVIPVDEDDHINKSSNNTYVLGHNATDQLKKCFMPEIQSESLLEISNLELSPVKGLTLFNKNAEDKSATLLNEETERNFERDSLENPCLPTRIQCQEPFERPHTPPLSSRSSTMSYSFSVSPCLKLKRKNDSETFNSYNSIKTPGSAIITSTVRKRHKPDDSITSLSPKSRVNFKKIPQKLFSSAKKGRANQLIKSVQAKCLDQSLVVENSQHPLSFYYETAYEDPFAKNALHTNAFLEKQTMELIKWLNSVLTPPEELSSVETGIDIEKLWKKSIATDVLNLAPTKDEVSTKYHADEGRLMAVRKAALALYKSEKIAKVLHGVHIKIESGVFDVKDDLDLHCDQGIRYKLVQLVTYYNPLWLRIGLETIYNQVIYVPSNGDSMSALIYFLKKYFLSDNHIIKKNTYSKNTTYKMPNFKHEMNCFIVFKFLALVFFLDKAKTERIMPYDPCLFRKSALIKESEALLNEFIKDFIKCVGAQKRTMAAIGYSLTHKQTYLDEYDFSVTSFKDLRDGVVLTRAMEIILKKTHLSQQLRTPAVSRLQKVHNVKLSLDALRAEGYEITEDITAYDVVDGHREKIMSLLWQILHRFLGPRYHRSAVIIQNWWRKKLPLLTIRRYKRIASAVVIQAWWRGVMLRKNLPTITKELLKIREEKLNFIKQVIRIQTWYRSMILMKSEKEKYLNLKQSAIKIQRWYRTCCKTREYVNKFRIKKKAIIKIQKWFKSILQMKKDKENFQNTKYYAICIQRKFRSCQITKTLRNEFLTKKFACIKLQRWYRSVKKVQHARKHFIEKRNAAIVIQRHLRCYLDARNQQARFNRNKQACIIIQRWFRSVLLMKLQRQQFLCFRDFVVLIQRRFRGQLEMKKQREQFLKIRHSIITIQNWYRGVREMQQEKIRFHEKRNAVITIQKHFRGLQESRNQRAKYIMQKQACITIQGWFRSVLLMKRQREQYLSFRECVVLIQNRLRGYLKMKKQRAKFLKIRHSIITIQNWYRSVKEMQLEKKSFHKTKNAVITIQKRFRAFQKTRNQRAAYIRQKQACITIQRWFRNMMVTKMNRQQYLCLREYVVLIQRRFRGQLEMKKQREQFLKTRDSIITIQNWYRSVKEMQQEKKCFHEKRNAVITIQKHFRGLQETRNQRAKYIIQKHACITIQGWFRSVLLMKRQREQYLCFREFVVLIQRRFRGYLKMKKQRAKFLKLRHSAITIQNWYGSVKEMQQEKKCFHEKRNAVITIQKHFRGLQKTRNQRVAYIRQKQACIIIQRWYRNVLATKLKRQQYLCLREFVVLIQRRYRGRLEMKIQRERFLKIRHSVITIQKWYRDKNEAKKVRCMNKLINARNVNLRAMRVEIYNNQIAKENACIIISNWWITNKEMRKFKAIKKAVLTIQRWYRSWKETKKLRQDFMIKKNACIIIQTGYRGLKIKKEQIKTIEESPFAKMTPQERKEYDSAVIIQSKWRGYICRKKFSNIVESIQKKLQIVKMSHGDSGISGNERLIELFEKSINCCVHDTFKLKKFKTLWLTFRNLDFITLHSPVLCEKLAQYNQFFAIAWDTLDLQTRSDPYIKVFGHVLNIFMNLARYEKTSASIHKCLLQFNGCRIVATLMGKTIEKHSSLFCKCVCLLWIVFSQDNNTAEIVKDNPEFRKKIMFYYKQIVRKPIKKKTARREIPQLVSDWGYKNVRREFLDEYAAMTELFQVLKLSPP
ncbi:microtubule assembly factor abnormal spindle isoform X2 [Rhodnius prolixus]|uniref:microtubule assembly factor abnormal spindle isoform X2 n=1 Tax=Rhodnius prolixus TaxID=13249 RepID=UPI003D18D795